jgi:hypothetical protein
MEATQNSNNEE